MNFAWWICGVGLFLSLQLSHRNWRIPVNIVPGHQWVQLRLVFRLWWRNSCRDNSLFLFLLNLPLVAQFENKWMSFADSCRGLFLHVFLFVLVTSCNATVSCLREAIQHESFWKITRPQTPCRTPDLTGRRQRLNTSWRSKSDSHTANSIFGKALHNYIFSQVLITKLTTPSSLTQRCLCNSVLETLKATSTSGTTHPSFAAVGFGIHQQWDCSDRDSDLQPHRPRLNTCFPLPWRGKSSSFGASRQFHLCTCTCTSTLSCTQLSPRPCDHATVYWRQEQLSFVGKAFGDHWCPVFLWKIQTLVPRLHKMGNV